MARYDEVVLRVELFLRDTPDLDECLMWPFSCTQYGYGNLWHRGRMVYAHRTAFELVFGDPGALHVLHRCDNPPCFNPLHLFAGTRSDNMMDCAKKGRIYRRAKVSKVDVRAIRAVRGRELQRVTATRFGIDESTVSLIQGCKTWRHVQ